MKILLFGKDGQLGSELRRSLAPLGELVVLNAASREHCGDLANLSGIRESVRSIRPRIVVNAAAWTDVDKAEASPETVRCINALAPAKMAQAAQKVGALMLHFSSDYVFDGSGKRAWTEDDHARPLSAYGRSKLEGDWLVAANCQNHLIFRTSWLYSARATSFAARILRQARAGSDLAVVDDQIGAPTGADWVADMAALALRRVAQDQGIGLFGVYHLAAGGHTSWHGYARFLLECAELAGQSSQTGSKFIRAVSSREYPSAASRPHNSRLDTAKFCTAFQQVCPPWQDGIARLVKALD